MSLCHLTIKYCIRIVRTILTDQCLDKHCFGSDNGSAFPDRVVNIIHFHGVAGGLSNDLTQILVSDQSYPPGDVLNHTRMAIKFVGHSFGLKRERESNDNG